MAEPQRYCACGDVTNSSRRHGVMVCVPKGMTGLASPSPEADGFLHDGLAAVEMRANASARRTCRWCGSRMAWNFNGAYRCTGEAVGASCDEPGPAGPEPDDLF